MHLPVVQIRVDERELVRVLVVVMLGVFLLTTDRAVGEVPTLARVFGSEDERVAASLDELRIAAALDVPVARGLVERGVLDRSVDFVCDSGHRARDLTTSSTI
jgi:hypothetical protein